MTDFTKLFSQGEPDEEKLLQNGFAKSPDGYVKEIPLLDFLLRVTVSPAGVDALLSDPETDAPYTLHLVEGAGGVFVGEVRKAYEEALLDIAETCFRKAVFRNRFSKDLIEYARERYGEECEHLWEDTSEYGVLRRSDNRKWYAVIMAVAGNKVGLSTDKMTEFVNLMAEKGEVERLIHTRGFAPAWHMNKKSWISVLLNGETEFSTVTEMLDASRELALKK